MVEGVLSKTRDSFDHPDRPRYPRFIMPRMVRVVVPGVPHHVTQRGNNRQDVFFTDADRRFYLETLKDRAAG